MTIRKVKGRYRLVSRKGRNLGTFSSRSAAAERERQIRFFKAAKRYGVRLRRMAHRKRHKKHATRKHHKAHRKTHRKHLSGGSGLARASRGGQGQANVRGAFSGFR
jgi:hypothetical protein